MNYPNYFQFGQNIPAQTQQIQNNGLVIVRSEQEAKNYPVGYGNSVTFKDETSPYIYTKTMGFSQMDRPIFEKFKLVKEDVEETSNVENINQLSELKAEIKSIWNEIESLKKAGVEYEPI